MASEEGTKGTSVYWFDPNKGGRNPLSIRNAPLFEIGAVKFPMPLRTLPAPGALKCKCGTRVGGVIRDVSESKFDAESAEKIADPRGGGGVTMVLNVVGRIVRAVGDIAIYARTAEAVPRLFVAIILIHDR